MTTKITPAEGLRRCIGSERYGIKAHDAPIADFPAQPSQKDGLGRMCKPHWSQYTAGLARDAKARKTDEPATLSERVMADTATARKAGNKRSAAAETAAIRKKIKATPTKGKTRAASGYDTRSAEERAADKAAHDALVAKARAKKGPVAPAEA